jgi:regulator of protease activity HflC (stomatin/prohibitin superfamily)
MAQITAGDRPDKSKKPVPHVHPMQLLVGAIPIIAGIAGSVSLQENPIPAIAGVLVGLYLMASLQVASQWEKGVVLRAGRFRALRGPGAFWIVPILDTIPAWIDHRTQTTPFNAEQTLTKDTVPVDVDAVLFWIVWDAEKAALEIADYRQATFWAAQTALRDIIGETLLSDLLVGRRKLDEALQKIIDERTTPWGITVQSVEIRDVIIPAALQDAMSRQAQAERERQARVILGEAEAQIAERFVEAGRAYQDNPTALHLRAMNMLYEGLKEKGALVVVPSTAVESMGLGTIAGLTALANGDRVTR